MKENQIKGWLYLLPAIAFLGVFMVYPLVDVFVYSFEEGYNSASQTFSGVGLFNYRYVLRDPYFLQALKNTFILVIITVPVSTGLALLVSLGLNSIGIVTLVSVFMGAVLMLQMCINFESPFIPRELMGYATRETMILEFSSTVVALILAGRVGSSIASEIGTMRITEQIDALEIMGVNSASYLILPKIIATVIFFPLLAILSIVVGLIGGYAITLVTGIIIPDTYITGIKMDFRLFSIVYALIKMIVYAFVITSISGFYGYYAKGNSLEVGRASTKAVVVSSVVILMMDLIITQISYL